MPVSKCQGKDGRPGYRWGESGPCFSYQVGNEVDRKKAYARVRAFAYQITPEEARRYFDKTASTSG
jgi:hypothetical protein